jgi:hypothetical protein
MPAWAFVFQPPNGKCAFSKQKASVFSDAVEAEGSCMPTPAWHKCTCTSFFWDYITKWKVTGAGVRRVL